MKNFPVLNFLKLFVHSSALRSLNKIQIFLVILIAFSLFLRTYNLSNLYIFGFDEEYQATYAMTIVKDFHPIWIGVSASFLDFYLGPYFTYFTAFWLWFSNGDPILSAYVAAAVGVATTLAIFFTGWRFFNLTAGIVAGLLYAGLPIFVFYDQKYWNPMFVQLIVLAMFASLVLIKKSKWWWLLFTASVGAIFETDLAPAPLALIGVWLFIKGKYFFNRKLILACIGVFLLFYWPLLVFDYYHNWSNLTVLGRYSKQAKEAGARFDPNHKFLSLADTMGRFWYLEAGKPNSQELNIFCNSERTQSPPYIPAASAAFLLFFILKSIKGRHPEKMLSYFLLVSVLFYLLYTGGSFEYYLHGFITLFALAVGVSFSKASKKLKPILVIFLIAVLAAGVNTVLNSSDKYSLGAKKRLIAKVMEQIGGGSFSLEKAGECHVYEGWRYLFKIYGRTPLKSFTDQNFAWLYPEELEEGKPEYEVVVAGKDHITSKDMAGYDRIEEGGYAAYIKKLK